MSISGLRWVPAFAGTYGGGDCLFGPRIPAKAGIWLGAVPPEVPAFAGMSGCEARRCLEVR